MDHSLNTPLQNHSKGMASLNVTTGKPENCMVETPLRILLINGSQEEAQGIVPWLKENKPGCEVLFVPSIELALWLLDSRSFSMVVSSEILPDGSFERLVRKVESMKNPPDLLMIGTQEQRKVFAEDSVYRMASITPLGEKANKGPAYGMKEVLQSARQLHFNSSISNLGADIRNDLNNPLQEIVAMTFVAQTLGSSGGQTEEALSAINAAAEGMAEVVNSLEQKIRHTVEAHIRDEY